MNNNIEGPYKIPDTTLGEKVDRLTALVETGGIKEKKPRNFRIPFKGKVGKAKLKAGFATIVEIAENDAVNFTREKITDGTVKLGDTYHSVDDEDILSYKGKPLLIIPKKSKTPYNPNKVENNTFSQKHIMSRMMNETLDMKKKLGMAGMSIGAIILGAVIVYAFVAG